MTSRAQAIVPRGRQSTRFAATPGPPDAKRCLPAAPASAHGLPVYRPREP